MMKQDNMTDKDLLSYQELERMKLKQENQDIHQLWKKKK